MYFITNHSEIVWGSDNNETTFDQACVQSSDGELFHVENGNRSINFMSLRANCNGTRELLNLSFAYTYLKFSLLIGLGDGLLSHIN